MRELDVSRMGYPLLHPGQLGSDLEGTEGRVSNIK